MQCLPTVEYASTPALGYQDGSLLWLLGWKSGPQQKLEESQVRVGKRVWLPFLRARRYMQSRQSLLDCSLPRLFGQASRVLSRSGEAGGAQTP